MVQSNSDCKQIEIIPVHEKAVLLCVCRNEIRLISERVGAF